MATNPPPADATAAMRSSLEKRLNVTAGQSAKALKTAEKSVASVQDLKNNLQSCIDMPAPGAAGSSSARLTMYVPCGTEESTLNLGAANKFATNDTGITAETRTHIHLYAQTEHTYVSLGGPVIGSPLDPKPTHGATLGGFKGYAMVSAAQAFHESKGQQYILSTGGDVIVQAASQELLLQADAGSAEMFAGGDAAISAHKDIYITSGPALSKAAPSYASPLAGEVKRDSSQMAAKYALQGVEALQAVVSTVLAIVKPVKNIPAWNTGARRIAKVKAAAPAVISELTSLAASAHSFLSHANSIIVAAEGPAKVLGLHAALFGKASAVLGSTLTATVAGTIAGLKGMAYSSVWSGVGTSIESLKAVEIASREVSIEGKKAVHIATDGDAGIHAGGHAELCGKNAFVFADEQVLVANGQFGLFVEPNAVVMGRLPDSKIAKGKHQPPYLMARKASLVLAADKKCSLSMNANTHDMALKYTTMKFNGKDLCVDGTGKVMLL